MVQQQRFPFGPRPIQRMPTARFSRPMGQAPQMQMMRRGFASRGFGMPQANMIQPRNPLSGPVNGIEQLSPGGRGGFLARLFGGSGGNNVQNQAMRGGLQALGRSQAMQNSGTLLQTAAKPAAGISEFLNNTQQVLKAAQTLGPVVRQYGPLVKNLPAMWKLYRGLNEDSDDNQTSEEEEVGIAIDDDDEKEESTENTLETGDSQVETDISVSEKPQEQTRKQTNGQSIPKLYI